MKYIARIAAIVCCVTLFFGMSSCKKETGLVTKEYNYVIEGEISDTNTEIDPETGQIVLGDSREVRLKLEQAISQLTGVAYGGWTTKDLDTSKVKAATDEAIAPYQYSTTVTVDINIVKKTLDKSTNTTTDFTIATYKINVGQ